jgi:hypothetical protein
MVRRRMDCIPIRAMILDKVLMTLAYIHVTPIAAIAVQICTQAYSEWTFSWATFVRNRESPTAIPIVMNIPMHVQ